MAKVLIIARKEIKEVFKTRSTIILGLVFAGFFAFMYSQNVVSNGGTAINGAIFFLSLSIAIFTAYTTTAQIFLLEKREGVIETLMCAPVSLRQIWAGKTVAGVVPSWLVSLFAAIMVMVISGIKSKTLLIPDIAVIVNVLVVVPVFISAFVGLVGFGQLLLGMKENRLLSFIIFMPAFAALYGSGFAIASNLDVSWLHVGIVLCIALALLGLGTWLTGFLNRERIVTTIE
jgi:ABC-2 type transport system permease protein